VLDDGDRPARPIADVRPALRAADCRADLAFFHAKLDGQLISRFTNDASCAAPAANVLAGIGRTPSQIVFPGPA